MPYYEVANLVTVTKTNMIDEMPCAYGTLRTTALTIRHQVSRRAAQWSQLLQNLTRTHCDVWLQLATTLQYSFTIGYRQSKKNQRNWDRRAICNATRGIGAGRGVICHRGSSDGSDGGRPLWHSHSARTEMFFADVLWDKHSTIPSVLRCLDWLSTISFRTSQPTLFWRFSISFRTPTPSSFGAPQFHSALLNPSSFSAPQLKLDALLFHSALLQHLLWYSSFPHNTPHLALLFSPDSCSHFSSECIIFPLIPPFRFAAS